LLHDGEADDETRRMYAATTGERGGRGVKGAAVAQGQRRRGLRAMAAWRGPRKIGYCLAYSAAGRR